MSRLQSEDVDLGYTQRRGVRLGSSLSEINIIPLVDVMLVLLIIFMVAAPMLQRGLDVRLPEARQADPISSERIFITVPISYRADGIVQFDDEPVRAELLQERLRQVLINQSAKDVYLRGDGQITYQELMSVMDILKDGGVENVGLVAALPGEQ